MVAVPAATPVAKPLLFTVANEVWSELQVTPVVISWLVPSDNMPVAVNWLVAPVGTLGLAGVTNMKTSETPGGNAAESEPPAPPPHPAKRRKITKRGIIPVNNHLCLKLLIILPPVYRPFKNDIMDSRINDIYSFALIARCNFPAMVHKTRKIASNEAIYTKCIYFSKASRSKIDSWGAI